MLEVNRLRGRGVHPYFGGKILDRSEGGNKGHPSYSHEVTEVGRKVF